MDASDAGDTPMSWTMLLSGSFHAATRIVSDATTRQRRPNAGCGDWLWSAGTNFFTWVSTESRNASCDSTGSWKKS